MARRRSTVLGSVRHSIQRGDKLLVAVSGGIDSSVLLHALTVLRAPLQLTIEVAHIDHNLRSNSGEDAQFVERLCHTYDLPFHLHTARNAPRSNIEAWGRRVRYTFLSSVRRARALDWIVTAHTANDLSETLLMKLIANKECSLIAERDLRTKRLRPLLAVGRKEIERYAKAEGLKHREDPSNKDLKFLRNKVRTILIPFLAEQLDPHIVEILSLRGRSINSDIKALRVVALGYAAAIERHPFGTRAWRDALKKTLSEVPQALGWRILQLLLKPEVGFALGEPHCLRFAAFLRGNGRVLELPGGLQVVRKGGLITIDHQFKRKLNTV